MGREIPYNPNEPQQLWQKQLFPVYLFWGSADKLKEEAVAALKHHLIAPSFVEFDYEVLDASTNSIDAILSAAYQAPFGSSHRLLVVHGAEVWREKARSGDADRLAEAIPRLPASCCIALIAAAQSDEDKRKTVLTSRLDKVIGEIGALVPCRAPSLEIVQKWLLQKAREENKNFEPEALELLITTTGQELYALEQELAKLFAYTGTRSTITKADVQTLATDTPEEVIFAAVDAVVKRQTELALHLLAELHRYDPKPQAVAAKFLALLARQFRLLWQAKLLIERRIHPSQVSHLPEDIATELPKEASITGVHWKARELYTLAKQWSWHDLADAMDQLLECDTANKGAAVLDIGLFGADPARNLQILVLSLATSSTMNNPVGGTK
ncbi:DNA polymerase III, delta subunit [Chthonomonas calidirosea]|uniref:DNA polymerase III subunit delta n=1 Tax=Chthonomonas calidirosea TaxID=454171 RepID=UPI0006DD3D24|nr:DNA polymerase III subunit delta [Chthonomonas calidirosea]CEK13334.1 DNA polymerase III, delta subunit [Chthonomonas calidirosea]